MRRAARESAGFLNVTSQAKEQISIPKNMSESFIETVNWLCTVGAVLLAILAAALGAIGWYFSQVESKLKEEKLFRYQQEASARISEAQSNAAKANEGAELAKKEAAQAYERAAQANLAAEQLRAKLAWRGLSLQQIETLRNRFSKYSTPPNSSGLQRLAVFSTSEDIESLLLADALAEAFGPQGAGFSINRYPVMYGKKYSVSGIGLLVGENEHAMLLANQIVSTLQEFGLSAFVLSERRVGDDGAISMIIGDRL